MPRPERRVLQPPRPMPGNSSRAHQPVHGAESPRASPQPGPEQPHLLRAARQLERGADLLQPLGVLGDSLPLVRPRRAHGTAVPVHRPHPVGAHGDNRSSVLRSVRPMCSMWIDLPS